MQSKQNKIIGFTISKNEINHDDIDVFNAGLNLVCYKVEGLFLYFWGMFGEDGAEGIKNCKPDANSYSLSFPLTDSLLERNVVIRAKDGGISVENDWLGSIPVFYNSKDIIISTLSIKTLTENTKDISLEGMANFLNFGHCAFELTPFEDIKSMRFLSKATVKNSKIEIEYKPDIINLSQNEFFDEEMVMSKIQNYLRDYENKVSGDIIIPTTAGHDSRLLNVLISQKDRIRSFTGGTVFPQEKCHEVVYAKKFSEISNIKWNQVDIGYDFFDKFYEKSCFLRGFSACSGSVWFCDFLDKIVKDPTIKNPTLLSGLTGETFAGKYCGDNAIGAFINKKMLDKFIHNIRIDAKFNKNYGEYNKSTDKFLNDNMLALNNGFTNIVFKWRTIIMSMNGFLIEYFGIPISIPYVSYEIANAMSYVTPERRIARVWQKDFFKKKGADVDSMISKKEIVPYNIAQNIDYKAFVNSKIFEELDVELMSKYVDGEYIKKINQVLNKDKINFNYRKWQVMGGVKILNSIKKKIFRSKKMKKAFEKFSSQGSMPINEAINSYLVLNQIIPLLKRK